MKLEIGQLRRWSEMNGHLGPFLIVWMGRAEDAPDDPGGVMEEYLQWEGDKAKEELWVRVMYPGGLHTFHAFEGMEEDTELIS